MTEPIEPRKRSRLRRLTSFSLRTALIAVTVLAVGLGLHMNSVRKQRAAIEAVLHHGGDFAYDYQRGHVNAQSPVPAWLLKTLGPDHFHSVASAYINNEEVLRDVDGFPKLKFLGLTGLQLRDTDLKYVSQLTSLEVLLISPPYTPSPKGGYGGTYSDSEITDDGLIHLKRLTQLRNLVLTNSNVTEGGLRHLGGLKKLERLGLTSTKVKDASWLQERLPNCKIRL